MISGVEAGGLKDALTKLDESVHIHIAMKEAFLRLYGFTSDEEGIRHPILNEQNVGFVEAKFMLVACSAFVNYLIQQANTAKLI